MAEQTQILVAIRGVILAVLGSDGINSLGVFELINNGVVVLEVPAIEIRYGIQEPEKNITKRMKLFSGVRVTIFDQPDIVPSLHKNRNILYTDYYTIAIDDFHPTRGLSDSIKAICGISSLRVDPSIAISSARQGDDGFTPTRALLYVRRDTFQLNNY